MIYAKKEVSDHIQVAAFPSAKEAGEVVAIGSLVGVSDYKTGAGEQGTVNVGKQIAVFQVKLSDLPAAAIGTDVFVTSAGALSAAATGNKPLGTVVAVGADTFDVAVTG